MIDEKKLIESFRASLNTGRETFPIDLIIERIEDQPKVGEWIPCSERLPNVEDFIKAYRRKKYSAEFIVMIDGATRPTTLYFRKTGKWEDEYGNSYKVVAWQPLPEPYQKGE